MGSMTDRSDHFVRALVRDADMRALGVVATASAAEACRRHGCAPSSAILLSEGLTAGLLLARLHKAPMRVTLQIECDGPLRGLVVDADIEGGVRGYVRSPTVNFPSAEGPRTEPAFGARGIVNVLREMKPGQWYRGTVEMPGRRLAPGVEDYLRSSEQSESALDLAVLLDEAGVPKIAAGVLFQVLPGGNRAALEAVRGRLEGGFLADLLGADADLAAGGILDAIMGGEDGKGGENLQILERSAVAFSCPCSRERVVGALLSLGPDELTAMIEEDGGAKIHCDFCAETYRLDRAELGALRDTAARRAKS
jgi:molecular chaperone Hsp33